VCSRAIAPAEDLPPDIGSLEHAHEVI